MSQQPQLSDDALTILLYLKDARIKTQRTRKLIGERCHMSGEPKRADNALKQLLDAKLLSACEGGTYYDLTEQGMRIAREQAQIPRVINYVNEAMAGANIHMTGEVKPAPTMPTINGNGNGNGSLTRTHEIKKPSDFDAGDRAIEETMRITWDEYADYRHHPLRVTEGNTVARPRDPLDRNLPPEHEVHFMLGFYDKRDQQPFAVMHGDVVGRAKTANVMLKHDNYISGNHCRFELRQERNTVSMLIEDMRSANGTTIDGKAIPPGKLTPLKAGSVVTIGRTNLVVIQVIYKPR